MTNRVRQIKSTSGLPATYGLSPLQTDQRAGAAARVWLGPREVFGLDRDCVCVCQRDRERGTAVIAFGYHSVSSYHESQCVYLGSAWDMLYIYTVYVPVCVKLVESLFEISRKFQLR